MYAHTVILSRLSSGVTFWDTHALKRAWRPIVLQAALLMSAVMLSPLVFHLPLELQGLRTLAPYLAVFATVVIAMVFNRGRAMTSALAFGIALGVQSFWGRTHYEPLPVDVAMLVGLFVMVNVTANAWLRERGAMSRFGGRRIFSILLQSALVAVLVEFGREHWHTIVLASNHWLQGIAIGALPGLFVLLAGVAFIACIAAALLRGSAVDAAFAGSIVAIVIACYVTPAPHVFGVFVAFGALGILMGVLQDAYRLAFRDELTGLPSRRALNERLLSLSDRYVIAMVDIDHFKRCNDNFGHDTGDQVLRMVASQLEQVGGGARAYRYGGEEFALVFAGRPLREVLPHLENLRRAIEHYRVALRASDRPSSKWEGERNRGNGGRSYISVTISIGVAEPDERLTRADRVLRAADEALYRAKSRGRNRVSR